MSVHDSLTGMVCLAVRLTDLSLPIPPSLPLGALSLFLAWLPVWIVVAVALLFWRAFVPLAGPLVYLMRWKKPVVDDLAVNMVDVGEETGALDDMLYKVADVYDEEVEVRVESLVSLLEPIMVVVLGLIVGFIVIALFMPLIKLLNDLS